MSSPIAARHSCCPCCTSQCDVYSIFICAQTTSYLLGTGNPPRASLRAKASHDCVLVTTATGIRGAPTAQAELTDSRQMAREETRKRRATRQTRGIPFSNGLDLVQTTSLPRKPADRPPAAGPRAGCCVPECSEYHDCHSRQDCVLLCSLCAYAGVYSLLVKMSQSRVHFENVTLHRASGQPSPRSLRSLAW